LGVCDCSVESEAMLEEVDNPLWKKLSITNKIDYTASSPNTSIKLDIKSRHEFLIALYL
jgi:hypothetical protein